MSAFTSLLLWTVDGKIRREANPKNPNHHHPGQWEQRTVVLAAKDFGTAHELAVPALLHNWSQFPHEAELYAVRPATAADLNAFAYISDPAFRVLMPGGGDE